jgi:hypothetical protein
MNRAAAILLTLMFLELQAMSAAPSASSVTQTGNCCGCKKHECCVTEKSPETPPLPAAPAPAGPQHEISLLPPRVVAWTLPVTESSFYSSVDCLSSFETSVPLFTWHCSFLI